MAESQRKVELQEPDDLRYLLTNIRRAANSKIDEALPAIEGEDAMRTKVIELVHEYINKTFTLAAPNILINGHELPASSKILTEVGEGSKEEKVEEYEPFDEKLRDRVAKLLQQESELLVEVGQLRRTAPLKAAEMWKEELSWIEDLNKEIEEDVNDGGPTGAVDVDLGVDKLERQEEVEATWKRGVDGLRRLKREMPATAAKMERAKRAGEYALAER